MPAWRDLREHGGLLRLPQKHRHLWAGLSSQSGRHALRRYGDAKGFLFFHSCSISPIAADVNECQTGNVCGNHSCFNLVGAYRCECRKGFFFNDGTKRCEGASGMFEVLLWSCVDAGGFIIPPSVLFFPSCRRERVQVLPGTLRSQLREHGGLLQVQLRRWIPAVLRWRQLWR